MVLSILKLPITYQKEGFLAIAVLFGFLVVSARHHAAQPMGSSLLIYLPFVEYSLESVLAQIVRQVYPFSFEIQRTVYFQLKYVDGHEILRQPFLLIDRLALKELSEKLLVELLLVYAQEFELILSLLVYLSILLTWIITEHPDHTSKHI